MPLPFLLQTLFFKCHPAPDVLHQRVKLLGIEGLRAVAQGALGVVVHLDHQAVRTGGNGRARERLHHPADARRVGGIDDHRQVALLLDDRHGGNIEVKNRKVGGLEFTFTLPKAKGETAEN